MKEKLTDKDIQYIYVLKGIACFCVVCAHCTPISTTAGVWSIVASEFLDYLGTMGVPIFFLISGYLFERNTRSLREFWKRKFSSIIVPWFFCETILWLYIVLRKGNISIESWIMFILGYQHTTYYLTVLMVLYIMFWFVKKNWQIYLLMLISVFSILSTGWQTGIDFINLWTGTFYLNPLNWIVFFAMGLLLNRMNWLMEWYKKFIYKIFIWIILSFIYFFTCLVLNDKIYYFSHFALLAHLINILMLSAMAESITKSKFSDFFVVLGKCSFSIYLLHQFVVGIVVTVSNKLNSAVIVMIRPFIVIACVMFGIYFLKWLNRRCCNRLEIVEKLIGVR